MDQTYFLLGYLWQYSFRNNKIYKVNELSKCEYIWRFLYGRSH